MVSPDDLARVIPRIRRFGRDVEIVVRATITPTPDPDVALRIARDFAAFYFSVETYFRHQEWLGKGPLLDEFRELVASGRREEAAAALPREVVETHFFAGSAEVCRRRVQDYYDAGADTVVLSFLQQVADPWTVAHAMAPGSWGSAG